MEELRISGKHLGELALSHFCPRCFWIKLHVRVLPFQIFPGIFSSIDSYTKKVTNIHFERYRELPRWFEDFGTLGEPVKVPHYNQYQVFDRKSRVLLTGVPDEILKRPDGSYFIVDYKTGRFTGRQNELFPLYEVQLNSYAWIGERVGFHPIGGLGLIYYEPLTGLSKDSIGLFLLEEGFSMHFAAKLLPVKLRMESIPPLLEKAREIYEKPNPPQGAPGCVDCKRLDTLLNLLRED